jgi:hypothetical protein
MNDRQKRVLGNWRSLLWDFVKREWLAVLLWSGLGAIGASLVRLIFQDRALRKFFVLTYLPPSNRFDDVSLYFSYGIALGAVLTVAILVRAQEMSRRGLSSWWSGVTSGLCFLPFVSTLLALALPFGTVSRRLYVDLAFVLSSAVVAFLLHLRARVAAERLVSEESLRVPQGSQSLAGVELTLSDDPIQTWAEDALGRASMIDNISAKIMIARNPVIGVFGKFGSGKTSILNLLREHLKGKAIVVSFTTWLPGSQETLSAYLLADIANECRKHYLVPGMSKSARRLANALSRAVPLLQGYSELSPAPTQRDDIESMKTALTRLPKRVVVLLDELDRMEKKEILTLLKVIRGISTLPNLSFVCALDLDEVVRIVKKVVNAENTTYFDKFFPISVPVPLIDSEALENAGVQRLVRAFEQRNWFANESEKEEFRGQLAGIWKERIALACPNLRAIGLLANDAGTAASLLKGEVNPIDLILIEMLHRFFPTVYGIVSRNSLTLTGGDSWLKGGEYHSDGEKKVLRERLLEDIGGAEPDATRRDFVDRVLRALFPRYSQLADAPGAWSQNKREAKEDDRRVRESSMFPAYFRYELPESVFSSVELGAFLLRIRNASGEDAQRRIFLEELGSLEKGSLKRDDFLRKLSEAAATAPAVDGRTLVRLAMGAADKYSYDSFFTAFGEAGHVLRMVLGVAKNLHRSERAPFLAACITEAADDTMAFRILTRLSGRWNDFDLGVRFSELYPAFISRMRSRYGRDVDVANVDITTSDKNAFALWGNLAPPDTGVNPSPAGSGVTVDPEDRVIQREFWLRFINGSRRRLAESFQGVFMPVGIYEVDPASIVEMKIPVDDLRKLYEALVDGEPFDEFEQTALPRLKDFLDGKFKGGVGVEQLQRDGVNRAEGEEES